MSPQSRPRLDISYLDTSLQEQPDTSAAPTYVISNVEFAESLPKEHVLSYLVHASPDSSGGDVYETLARQTVDPEGLNTIATEEERRPRHVIYLRTKPRQSAFISLQKWEGVVLDVMVDAFLARLVDLTRTGPDEEAEFPLDEISAEDRLLVKPGAIFYWNIGYLNSYSGQLTRASIIRFRRLPAWTRKEIETARREAARIKSALDWT